MKPLDLALVVGIVVAIYYIFKGKDTGESSFNGDFGGLGGLTPIGGITGGYGPHSGRPVPAVDRCTCCNYCINRYLKGTIKTPSQLGNCLINRCKLKRW
jgi:hypothetical protein